MIGSLTLASQFLPSSVRDALFRVTSLSTVSEVITKSNEFVKVGLHESNAIDKVAKSERHMLEALAHAFGLIEAITEKFPLPKDRNEFLIGLFGDKIDNPYVAAAFAVHGKYKEDPKRVNPFTEPGRINLLGDYMKFLDYYKSLSKDESNEGDVW